MSGPDDLDPPAGADVPLAGDELDERAARRARRIAQREAEVRRRRLVAALALLVLVLGGGFALARGLGDDDAERTAASGTGGKGGSGASAATGETSSATAAGSGADAAATTARAPKDGPPITIGWAGDSIPATEQFGLPGDPGELLGSISSLLKKPDLMIVNLEGTLTARGSSKCGADSTNCYAFRAPPAYAKSVFKAAGVDAVNTANNHANDFGADGIADTRKALDGAEIAYTGAPGEVTVVDVEGVAVALVGFSSYTWSAPLNDPAEVERMVQEAAGKADLVVAILHGGAEGRDKGHVPEGAEEAFGENRGDLRAFARTAIDAGADLVVGSGPHVMRGMEFYKGRLIAYSLGNLVGYSGAFATGGELSITGILRVELKPDGTWVDGTLDPLVIGDDGIPRPDQAETAHGTVRQLSKDDFGKRAAQIARDGTISPP